MMMSLFTVFDPTSYFGVSFNFIIIFMIIMFYPVSYYLFESGFMMMVKMILYKVEGMFKDVSIPNYMAINYLCVMTFVYLFMTNLLGLFPFIFTSSAQPLMTMGFGVVMWLSFFIMGWMKSFKESAAHLVPEGSPIILSPLLVLIESVSHVIRPFTLSIRLAANMMAGHLIIGLLSEISMISMVSFSISLMLQFLLLVLEMGVAIIQGFVFSILTLLYVLDYY